MPTAFQLIHQWKETEAAAVKELARFSALTQNQASDEKLIQPWREIDPDKAKDLSDLNETWMQTLEDNRDLSGTSLGSCLQARVAMNKLIVKDQASPKGYKVVT